MVDTTQLELAGRTLMFETGRVGKQANGAVVVRMGDTIVFAAATMAKQPREGIDFFPLTCDYEERLYAVGKIPGGFYKREGRPSERAILTSRLMDRPIRPLFPAGMRNDVQVITIPLSVDPETPPDILAINAASAALALSDIPWNGPIGAVRVGMIDGELIANPSRTQIREGQLDLVVAGTAEQIIMVECGANEVPEERMLAAMEFGHGLVREICQTLLAWRERVGKPKSEVTLHLVAPELVETICARFGAEIRAGIVNPDKAAREEGLDELKNEILARVAEEYAERLAELPEAIEAAVKKEVRRLILAEGRRPDGRSLAELRPISCEVGFLPRTHGSALFTRGQTQALTVCSLGTVGEEQIIDGLGEEESKSYMHHYNFPPFSVGEVRPLRGPGRREIGHGALAERALRAVLPDQAEFPYTIRLVTDILESNGSTSMAATCGSTLALMDAGVPIRAPVAGIAMGLMSDGDRYAVLTDIQGMEDFSGDMDFKVAGTRLGITAIQMDTKISGIPIDVLRRALEQAREARLFILDRMQETIAAPREELSPWAPRIYTLEINPERIGDLIGPGGRMIRKIQADTNTKIDVMQDGTVFVASVNAEGAQQAIRIIEGLVKEANVGEVFTGRVTRLMGKGAMVEYAPGKEGLIPTSELSWHRVMRPDDVVRVGDEVRVKVVEIDAQGRVNLSRKQTIPREEEGPPPYAGTAPAGPPRGAGGPPRGERGGRGFGPRPGGRDERSRDGGRGGRGPGGPPPGGGGGGGGGVGARFRPPRRRE